jgi:hypothetical protein
MMRFQKMALLIAFLAVGAGGAAEAHPARVQFLMDLT